MTNVEMVNIVDMTAEQIRKAADGHRVRGQHDTAESMMRLPPMLAALSEKQKARLRRLPVGKLRIELTRLVLLHEAGDSEKLTEC